MNGGERRRDGKGGGGGFNSICIPNRLVQGYQVGISDPPPENWPCPPAFGLLIRQTSTLSSTLSAVFVGKHLFNACKSFIFFTDPLRARVTADFLSTKHPHPTPPPTPPPITNQKHFHTVTSSNARKLTVIRARLKANASQLASSDSRSYRYSHSCPKGRDDHSHAFSIARPTPCWRERDHSGRSGRERLELEISRVPRPRHYPGSACLSLT